MKKRLFILLSIFISASCCLSQDTAKARQLIEQGIKLHDAEKYPEAILAYREALAADPGNARAVYEMSYSYYMAKDYDSAVILAEKVLNMKASDDVLKNDYVSLGTFYDDLKDSKKAEETYKEGIKKFPDFYLLYFNLGITYYYEDPPRYDLALQNFQKSVELQPFHAGSNFWQYKALKKVNKIPAVLAAATLCLIEQNTKRSEECAAFIEDELAPDIAKDSLKKNITIYIPASSLSGGKENNFSAAELGLSLMIASKDIADTLQLDTKEKKLSFQLQELFNFFSDSKQHEGFYWKFYAPFFYELKVKDYTDILVHIILMNSQKDDQDWITNNPDKVNEFYDWVKKYKWSID